MRDRLLASLIAAGALLAGCRESPAPEPPSKQPAQERPACVAQPFGEPKRSGSGFDGEAALGWVEAIVNVEGGLRPRTPADRCREQTVAWLHRALDVPGWTVQRQSFTGRDYLALDKGAARSFMRACNAADRAQVPELKLTNLYAVRRGTADRTLLVGAHWDAKEDAKGGGVVPGANDGASGMGVLLELMRTLEEGDIRLPFHLVVAFFDGEDGFQDCHPLAGSLYFAQNLPLPVDRMLLLDMVGDAEARFPRERSSVKADRKLVELIWSKAATHGLSSNFTRVGNEIVDDHRPFIEAGIPAVDLIDNARKTRPHFPPYWHTPDDTVDKLSADMLGKMGRLLLDVLQDPAFVAQWP
jgi:hypothetical protein